MLCCWIADRTLSMFKTGDIKVLRWTTWASVLLVGVSEHPLYSNHFTLSLHNSL